MLHEPLYCGGFEFDIVVGINRGGLFTADLISREYGHNMPVMVLFADRRNKIGKFDSEDIIINNRDIIQIPGDKRISSILLVDSFSRRGKTILNAKAYWEKFLKDKQIKTALVYADETLKLQGKVDYVARYRDLKRVTFKLI